MDKKATVKAECHACQGTGLYRGMAEKPGIAVVCLACKGTGCREFEYIPFTSRNVRHDVKEVCLSRGTFILSCGPVGTSVTYAEFLGGKMPVARVEENGKIVS